MNALPIDEDQIKRGRELKRLKESTDFVPLFVYIRDRISTLEDRIKGFRVRFNHEKTLIADIECYQELTALLDWIDDEIDRGADEILRKVAAEAHD